MTLVDTSIWIDHFRQTDPIFSALLDAGEVFCHSFIIGELALGNLRPWERVLGMLQLLPQITAAMDNEVLDLITRQTLFGLGIGYGDVHLLAAARLTPGTLLWTRDKRLFAAAVREGLAAMVQH